jgi:hypothetical protein
METKQFLVTKINSTQQWVVYAASETEARTQVMADANQEGIFIFTNELVVSEIK